MKHKRHIQIFNHTLLLGISIGLTAAMPVHSQSNEQQLRNPNQLRLPARSPKHEQEQSPKKPGQQTAARFPHDIRTINGAENNLQHPDWGQADIEFIRLAPAAYTDGSSTLAGSQRPSARLISNIVVATDPAATIDGPPISDMVWQWGQFLDHDIDLTPEVEPSESAPITVPAGDQWFDPGVTGTQTIALHRSLYNTVDDIREQLNLITAYIDASNVYGSDAERATALRTNDGTGKLLSSDGNLLPFNTSGLPNAPSNADSFFIAGDFRANEQVGLTSMHTLFMREHNRIAEQVKGNNPILSGENVYQTARALVGAQIQAITYREFLPVLLGNDALPPYRGYKPTTNAGISNEFATAAYRFGHTMVSPQILRLNSSNQEIGSGHLSLDQAFFSPDELIFNGIDPLLRGLSNQRAQKVDSFLVDALRNLLFGPPGAGGLDLAALNIQRGRDHGLSSYNETRKALGLPKAQSFADITPDQQHQHALESAYGSVDSVDLWVGGLAEPATHRGIIGNTFRTILIDQFTRLRDGDRFWYETYLPQEQRDWVNQQSLAKIIRRNTSISDEISDHVFVLSDPDNQPTPPRQTDRRPRKR